MAEYQVAYMVVYSEVVDADSPEEAAEIVYNNCPYDVDGDAWVTNLGTGSQILIRMNIGRFNHYL